MFDKLPYDTETDLIPVTRLFFLTEGLFISAELPAMSVAELKTLANPIPTGSIMRRSAMARFRTYSGSGLTISGARGSGRAI